MVIDRIVDPKDFPASQTHTYLDAAYNALIYAGAADAVIAWQRDYLQEATTFFTEEAEDEIYNKLRNSAAELLHANNSDIAIGSSSTELLSSLAWAILPSSSKSIVGTDISFPSTIYPWQRVARHSGCQVRMARVNKDGYIDQEELLDLIDSSTSLVCVSHVEYQNGQTYDLNRLAEKAHKHNAFLIVDATQSAGQIPIDVRESNVDALVSSAYKWLCGPFGVAIMYLTPQLQSELDPGQVGWRSHKDIWDLRANRLEYPKTAKRFEASTMAYSSVIGLIKAIDYINSIGVDRVLEHNKYLTNMIANESKERGGRVVSPEHESERSSIISIEFPGRNAKEIVDQLASANVNVSYRGGVIRFSPHLYNDKSDIDRAFDVLDEILD